MTSCGLKVDLARLREGRSESRQENQDKNHKVGVQMIKIRISYDKAGTKTSKRNKRNEEGEEVMEGVGNESRQVATHMAACSHFPYVWRYLSTAWNGDSEVKLSTAVCTSRTWARKQTNNRAAMVSI